MNNGKATRYVCKTCEKSVNVTNSTKNYIKNQKKEGLILKTINSIVTTKKVSGAIEEKKIAAGTYYHNIDVYYQKCIEFLEKYEDKKFKVTSFNELWLSTDKLIFVPNFQRKNGHKGESPSIYKQKFQCSVINTIDNNSNYVFRSDLTYDYNTNYKEIIDDINLLHEDKWEPYQGKNGKYSLINIDKYEYDNEYDRLVDILTAHALYHDGIIVTQSYTQMAHYWLLKQMLNADCINFVTDDDPSTQTTLTRVFKDDIKNKRANIFICNVPEMSLGDATTYHNELRKRLNILDRPKQGGRKENSKDYMHAPKNMEYVQKLLTIYRTVHNYCKYIGAEEETNDERGTIKMTPAMKLGIADSKFELGEILYGRK